MKSCLLLKADDTLHILLTLFCLGSSINLQVWMVFCVSGAQLLTLLHIGEEKEWSFKLSSEYIPWTARCLTANSSTLFCCTHTGSKFQSSCPNSWRYWLYSIKLQFLICAQHMYPHRHTRKSKGCLKSINPLYLGKCQFA